MAQEKTRATQNKQDEHAFLEGLKSFNPHTPREANEELRILLIGKTGDGKSATGNSILGKIAFESKKSAGSVTSKCQFRSGERFGRKVLVVDTPGLCDTSRTQREIKMELIRSLGFTTPGFHVIAFVLRSARYTKECEETKQLFFEWFGKGVEKHALIILTDWDYGDPNFDDYFTEQDELNAFKQNCGNRVVPFDNKASERDKDAQVRKLFSVVDEIIARNQREYFCTVAFRIAHTCIQVSETPIFKWLKSKLMSENQDETEDDLKEAEVGENSTEARTSGEFTEDEVNHVCEVIHENEETKCVDSDELQCDGDEEVTLRKHSDKPNAYEKTRKSFNNDNFLTKFMNLYDRIITKFMKKKQEKAITY